jgi:TonB-dependent SusC/RagA subfamily outer membrane receptor
MQNVSGSNRLNVLSGRLGGLTVTQTEGLPGYESPTLDIRGNHTFGSSGSPVILLDGRLTDINMLDPYDIESVTVLKDAAAAVMYGLRSTNGVILITSKKGQYGKIKVSFNSETSFSQPTRLPKFLDAANYATLYNEAQLNDNPAATPKYSADAIEAYRNGSNPYVYPNVNWTKEFLKDYSVELRNSISVSGGSKGSKYYVSASYLKNNGIFNTDTKLNTYSTNTGMSEFNIHGNV